ncbi:MAG TPA: winged helix DNA-binding domain-containing protein [Polyangia bacterium]|nr:winged helix DNA-binding domain-containing protein [Polyangia bacterium]
MGWTATPERLTKRGLNRALLARQWLLGRVRRGVPAALEHLVGLQAQNTPSPYLALWSRLEGFRPEALSRLLSTRRAVRLALHRSTIHLVTARDCLALRPVLAPVLARAHASSPFGKRLGALDLAPLVAKARALLEEGPLTTSELGARLAALRPGADAEALGYAMRALLPLVQVPPRGLWGEGGLPRCADAEAWLGRGLATDASPDAFALRYLAAFGPATAADFQAWSGLGGAAPLFARLRPRLRVLADERGRELFDVPRAPRPDPDAPAPPRLLPDYDNAFLAHADRARIVAAEDLPRMRAENTFLPPFLVDGFVAGTWKLERARERATLVLRPMRRLAAPDRAALEAEGEALLGLLAADARARDVRFAR